MDSVTGQTRVAMLSCGISTTCVIRVHMAVVNSKLNSAMSLAYVNPEQRFGSIIKLEMNDEHAEVDTQVPLPVTAWAMEGCCPLTRQWPMGSVTTKLSCAHHVGLAPLLSEELQWQRSGSCYICTSSPHHKSQQVINCWGGRVMEGVCSLPERLTQTFK